jgi:hypothetical protein
VIGTAAMADPVVEEKSWTTRYAMSSASPKLIIQNIWGGIKVRQSSGSEFIVTINERRSAPDQARFEKSKQLLPLNVQADSQTVEFRVGTQDHWRWGNNGDRCHRCRVDYQFDVQVPVNTNLELSTVMDGSIVVEGIHGLVDVSNVNGAIALNQIRQCIKVKTINRAIDLTFEKAPTEDCHIESINGDMTVVLPADSDINAKFKLINGYIRSDFDLTPLSTSAIVDQRREGGRNLYRIQQTPGVRIGQGGATLQFSGMNGDIILKKNNR